MNAPLNGLQQIIEQINGATADLRTFNKSEAWLNARDSYIRDSIRGDDDWTRMDDEASAHALSRIHDALGQDLTDREFRGVVQSILAGTIQRAATMQADILQRNGRLPTAADLREDYMLDQAEARRDA